MAYTEDTLVQQTTPDYLRDKHDLIGLEIARRKIQRTLAELVDAGKIRAEGERRARRYFFVPEIVEKRQNGTKIGSNRGAGHA